MFNFDDLQANLHVERLDQFLFRGTSLQMGLPRVFGGQVLAQSLNAAYRSVDNALRPHSLHAYFLRPGDTQRQIIYEVDPIRDGRSFSTRRVVAKQNGEPIFNASISFHKLEDGLVHQMDMPNDIPDPETMEPDHIYYTKLMKETPELSKPFYFSDAVVDVRTHGHRDLLNPKPSESTNGYWFKFKGKVNDDPIAHRTLLAFISDKRLMGTSLRPHPVNFHTHTIMGASLDHAMWFHTAINMDQWIYYHMDSPRAERARGFSRGSFYSQDGVLIASSAQEGLIRVKDKDA